MNKHPLDSYVLTAYDSYRDTMQAHGVPYPPFDELTRSRQHAWHEAIANLIEILTLHQRQGVFPPPVDYAIDAACDDPTCRC